MSLYFVHHQHTAETCLAKYPEMGPTLIQHVTKANARKFVVDLIGNAALAKGWLGGDHPTSF